MDDVHCAGNETAITQCKHRGWRVTDCDHSKDAGVICTPKGKYTLTLIFIIFTSIERSCLPLTESQLPLGIIFLYIDSMQVSASFCCCCCCCFFLVFINCTRFFFIAFDPCRTFIKWSTGIER